MLKSLESRTAQFFIQIPQDNRYTSWSSTVESINRALTRSGVSMTHTCEQQIYPDIYSALHDNGGQALKTKWTTSALFRKMILTCFSSETEKLQKWLPWKNFLSYLEQRGIAMPACNLHWLDLGKLDWSAWSTLMAKRNDLFSAAELALVNANTISRVHIFDNSQHGFLYDPTSEGVFTGEICIFNYKQGFYIGRICNF